MEIVVASGKGGTGKTFIASNLTYYVNSHVGEGVIAVDADVEAPDLLLALGGLSKELWTKEYYGAKIPEIDYSKCVKCWKCLEACQFNALIKGEFGPKVLYDRCEGLGTCGIVCPQQAISFRDKKTGRLFAALTPYDITVVTGDLEVGGGNSGRLVYELKNNAYKLSSQRRATYLVVDAAPGIGCPVISSIRGANILIVVVEPTLQSVKGAKRLLKTAEVFKVKRFLILNKYDLNPSFSSKISEILNAEVLGEVPYDESVVKSYSVMEPLIRYNAYSKASKALLKILENLAEMI